MCKTHNKVNGKAAVELYAEARILGNVCDRRMSYLKQQAMSFHTWLGTQAWCDDATVFCSHIVQHVEKALDRDADTWCEYIFKDDSLSDSEGMAVEYDEYEQELQRVVDRAYRSAYSTGTYLLSLESKLEEYKVELALHDRIQDYLDTLPPYTKVGMYSPVFRRLDALKNEGKLSYGGWLTFSNALMDMMGKKAHTSKYPVRDLADQVAKFERLVVDANRQIMEKEEFFSDPHEAADNFLKANE